VTTDAAVAEFDVVVAGGGLVGGSLAIALAEAGLQVALVEAVPPESAVQPSFDERTIALSHGSCSILQQLGVWPLLAGQIWPVQQIHVSEQGRFGSAVIDASEQGLQQLGYVIQGRALGLALWNRIEAYSNLTVYCPARVTTAGAVVDGRRTISLLQSAAEVGGPQHEQQLNTRLLAVADGARSPLRAELGISAQTTDYEQTALIAAVQVDARHVGKRAYERFTPAGPLALLPGADGRYTAVLAQPSAAAQALIECSDEAFLAHLQDLLGFRLGRLRRVGRRSAYPLSLVTAKALTAERAVMVGNAANSLHPVAGQGFNLGLRDAASLAELLARCSGAHDRDADPGAAALLQEYAEWRAPDQRNVVAFTDGLIRFFGRSGAALGASRGLGLALFDISPMAKRALAQQTMGLGGRMTRLARGLSL
jgi:2-octaprenyl-6-methoxyphenol hydroxylase